MPLCRIIKYPISKLLPPLASTAAATPLYLYIFDIDGETFSLSCHEISSQVELK